MITNDHTDAALADEARHIKKPPTVEAVEGQKKLTENTAKAEDAGDFGQANENRERSI